MINSFPETKRKILEVLKKSGPASIQMLQSKLGMTGEALRQHLLQLKHEGFVDRESKKREDSLGGRPAKEYYLTLEGQHLFPKNYDQLAIEIIDTVEKNLGLDALKKVLTKMTETRIKNWEPKLAGLTVKERAVALKGIYCQDDSFMEVKESEDAIYIIEHNCPIMNVVAKRPFLCSVTVSALTHLLGYEVERKKRFQNGDGCCVFKVQLDKPIGDDYPQFKYED